MSSYRRLLTALTLTLAMLFVAGPAFARGDSELSEVLGDIEWGDSKDEVLSKMKKKMMDELREDKKLRRDQVLLQKHRKRIVDEIRDAEKEYTELRGERTGYEVSVIADEFTKNNGESFFMVKDRVAKRYFFFLNRKLYKLVVAYNPSYLSDVGFEGFVASSVKKYGRPAVAEYDTIRGKEDLALVQWEDPETMLAVKNKKELFDTYTMTFADRKTVKRMLASKKNFGGSDKDDEEVSAAVKNLTEYGDYGANKDVVDGMVGSVNVDLSKGRPKDDEGRRYDEDGNVVEADAVAAAPKKDKKKKKRSRKKKKREKAPDFSKLEAKSGDDLIIY